MRVKIRRQIKRGQCLACVHSITTGSAQSMSAILHYNPKPPKGPPPGSGPSTGLSARCVKAALVFRFIIRILHSRCNRLEY